MNTETNSNNTNNTDIESAQLNRFSAYVSDMPIAIGEGMRLVKCLYKTNKQTGKAAGENSYILVPESHLSEEVIVSQIKALAPFVSAWLQSVEDVIIKDAHKSGSIGFADSFLSLDKITDYLESSGQSNRLNKEKIENWFNSDMQEPLIAAFADKMGLSDEPSETELERLLEISQVYKAKFASLASGKTMYKKEEAELLQKALDVTGAKDSIIGGRFNSRLEGMKTATSESLLMSL
jgi:hypothetical protein